MEGINRSLQNFSTSIEGTFFSDAGTIKRPVVPGRFEGAVPSNPVPAYAVASNDEEWTKRQALRAQEAAVHEAEMRSAMQLVRGEPVTEGAAPPTAKDRLWGAMKVVQGFAARTVIETQNSAYSGVRSVSLNRDLKLFLADFGELVRSGRTALLSAHEGSIISEGEIMEVDLFVSTTHLCIAGKSVVAAIPLREIAAMRPSVKLDTTIHTPYFMDLPDPRVKPNSLLIYVDDERKSCYQIFGMIQSIRLAAANASLSDKTPLELFYESLYCAWDRAGRVEEMTGEPLNL